MRAEEWRKIPGFRGYEVSSFGKVRSIPRITIDTLGRTHRLPGKLRKITQGTHYPVVSISISGKIVVHPVHVLVARAFLGKRPKGFHVRHLDGDASNPKVNNLKYGTPKENGRDTVTHGVSTKGMRNAQALLTDRQVRSIYRQFQRLNPTWGEIGRTMEMLGERYGVGKGAIKSILNGRSWSHITQPLREKV